MFFIYSPHFVSTIPPCSCPLSHPIFVYLSSVYKPVVHSSDTTRNPQYSASFPSLSLCLVLSFLPWWSTSQVPYLPYISRVEYSLMLHHLISSWEWSTALEVPQSSGCLSTSSSPSAFHLSLSRYQPLSIFSTFLYPLHHLLLTIPIPLFPTSLYPLPTLSLLYLHPSSQIPTTCPSSTTPHARPST